MMMRWCILLGKVYHWRTIYSNILKCILLLNHNILWGPYPVSTPTHLPISSQSFISPTPVHNLYSPCPVSAPYCLPMSICQCTIPPDHSQSIHHPTCLHLVSSPSLLLISSQHSMLPTSVSTVHLPISSQYPISPAYVQSKQQRISPRRVSTQPPLPMISRWDGVLTLYAHVR